MATPQEIHDEFKRRFAEHRALAQFYLEDEIAALPEGGTERYELAELLATEENFRELVGINAEHGSRFFSRFLFSEMEDQPNLYILIQKLLTPEHMMLLIERGNGAYVAEFAGCVLHRVPQGPERVAACMPIATKEVFSRLGENDPYNLFVLTRIMLTQVAQSGTPEAATLVQESTPSQSFRQMAEKHPQQAAHYVDLILKNMPEGSAERQAVQSIWAEMKP